MAATFLVRDDYKTLIKDAYLSQILADDPGALLLAEAAAISEMTPYLLNYDTRALFSATGENRHPLLVVFAVDIALYHLLSSVEHPRLSDGEGLRYKRYRRALEYLEQVRIGALQMDAPKAKENVEENKTAKHWQIRANPKRENHY